MKPSAASMQCPNRHCLYDENPLGQSHCVQCGTALIYRFLGVVGEGEMQAAAGTLVGDRYWVIAPQIWLDTQPTQSPEVPAEMPESALPYLYLHPYQLHLPMLYGFFSTPTGQLMLLENIPVEQNGKPLPTLLSALKGASPTRQLYWLWQMLELWGPLKGVGVASSLLISGNLRVEGWRLRLRSLFTDASTTSLQADDPLPSTGPTLRDMANLWMAWMDDIHPAIAAPLQALCQQMQALADTPDTFKAVSAHLNTLLLQQAAQLPLRLTIAGATSPGPQRPQNEDACYPLTADPGDPLMPQVAILCDGIGGHAGGEVASHMAVRSLQLQVRALLAEIAEQVEVLPPEIICQQLEAMVRVVNNLIATQNDSHGRSSRQRMGTTLVMAVQIPQRVAMASGDRNAHELYLVHTGDSRAYWFTANSAALLTVDDDLAGREVRTGRNTYREALKRSDAGALTQALGTRDANSLYPTVQRFIVEEDGVLLLCSDGVSDNGLVEENWKDSTRLLLQGKMTPTEAAQSWVALADLQNGHDNASAVVMVCRVAREAPHLPDPSAPIPPTNARQMSTQAAAAQATPAPSGQGLESSEALLYDSATEPSPAVVPPIPAEQRRVSWLGLTLGVMVLMFTLGAAGIIAWQTFDSEGFQRFWNRLSTPQSPLSPSPAPASPIPPTLPAPPAPSP